MRVIISILISIQVLFTSCAFAHGLTNDYVKASSSFRANLKLYYQTHNSFPDDLSEIINIRNGDDLNNFLPEPIESYIAYYGNLEGLPIFKRSKILALMTRPETKDSFYCYLLDRKGRIETYGISTKYLEKIGHPVPQGLKVYYHTKEHIEAVKKYQQEHIEGHGINEEHEQETQNTRPEKPLADPNEVEKLRAQGEQITEQESSSSEADKPTSFPWWLLGIVGLIVVLGFMLLKGKSK